MPKQPIKILRVSEREEICNLVEDIYARSLEEHREYISTLETELAELKESYQTACKLIDKAWEKRDETKLDLHGLQESLNRVWGMIRKAEDNVKVMQRSARSHDARLESCRLQGLRDAVGCFFEEVVKRMDSLKMYIDQLEDMYIKAKEDQLKANIKAKEDQLK